MKKLLILICIAGLFAACSNKNNEANNSNNMANANTNDMNAKNEARVKEFYDKVFNAHNPEVIDQFCTTDFVDHQPAPNHSGKGVDDLKADFKEWFAMVPDVQMTPEEITSKDNKVMVKFRMKGTNTGPMGPNMPATGKSFDVEGMEMIAFNSEGKATDRWGYFEEQKWMQQLGMMPSHEEMMKNQKMAEQEGTMEKAGKKMDKGLQKTGLEKKK